MSSPAPHRKNIYIHLAQYIKYSIDVVNYMVMSGRVIVAVSSKKINNSKEH